MTANRAICIACNSAAARSSLSATRLPEGKISAFRFRYFGFPLCSLLRSNAPEGADAEGKIREKRHVICVEPNLPPPYGHDGRSINLAEVILRHGGEAAREAALFDRLQDEDRSAVLEFLQSLVVFPPDDTSSNLNPGDRKNPNWPPAGHGSIKLSVLFNDPNDPE